MTVQSELLDLAHDYARGHAPLPELDRFIALTADEFAALPETDPLVRLAGLIDVTLAEMDDGQVGESEMRTRIAHFLESYGKQFRIDVGTGDSPQGGGYDISQPTVTTGADKAA